jgi:ADP-dependent phosphofructokinase/glucokinase
MRENSSSQVSERSALKFGSSVNVVEAAFGRLDHPDGARAAVSITWSSRGRRW